MKYFHPIKIDMELSYHVSSARTLSGRQGAAMLIDEYIIPTLWAGVRNTPTFLNMSDNKLTII